MTQPDPGAGESTGRKILSGALGGILGAGAADKAVGSVDQLGDVTDSVRAVRAWVSVRHNWVRVAWVVGGALMFAVGAVMLGERPVASAAEQISKPVGDVVKTVYK